METADTSDADDNQQLAWSQEIPDYGNKLLKRLDDFRKTTILYDVCVHAQSGDFNAHKVILAACGGIFRTCFVDEEKKMISDTSEITLECPAQGLKPIIRFAYTGALVVTKRNAVATMIAAEVTKMKEVQEICADIAFKEYGWVVEFSGEKTDALIQNLGKVLQHHSVCFTAAGAEDGTSKVEDKSEFPFTTEVEKEFSEHAITYRKLVLKLSSAKKIADAAAARKENEEGKDRDATLEAPTIPNLNGQHDIKLNGDGVTSDEQSSESNEELQENEIQKTEITEPEKVGEAKKKPRRDIPPPTPRIKSPGENAEKPAVEVNNEAKENIGERVEAAPQPPKVVKRKEVPSPTLMVKNKPEENVVKADTDSNAKLDSTMPQVLKRKDVPPPAPRVRPIPQEKTENLVKEERMKVKGQDGDNDLQQAEENITQVPKAPKKDLPPPSPRTKFPSAENGDGIVPKNNGKLKDDACTDEPPVDATSSQIVKTPRKDIPPPSPRVKSQAPNGSPKLRNLNETAKNGKVNPNPNDENNKAMTTQSPKTSKGLPSPAPKVHPRSSMKLKKAPPPPPATTIPVATEKPAVPSEKVVTKSPAPPRPTKAPAKIPPPRPKPPVKKKLSSETDTSTKTANEEAEYDDTLNPFA